MKKSPPPRRVRRVRGNVDVEPLQVRYGDGGFRGDQRIEDVSLLLVREEGDSQDDIKLVEDIEDCEAEDRKRINVKDGYCPF